jgi:hypothetical protein
VNKSEVDLVLKQGSQLSAYELKWGKKRSRSGRAFYNAYQVKPQTLSSTQPSQWPLA